MDVLGISKRRTVGGRARKKRKMDILQISIRYRFECCAAWVSLLRCTERKLTKTFAIKHRVRKQALVSFQADTIETRLQSFLVNNIQLTNVLFFYFLCCIKYFSFSGESILLHKIRKDSLIKTDIRK